MEDENYKLQQQENLRNPKNRFLGLFCHAKDVGSSWGCDWSFQTGVVIFSIVILICSFYDVYEIAGNEVIKKSPDGLYTFFFGLKIFSDVVNFAAIILSCFAVHKENLKFSVISYWVAVCSLLLNTIFFIYLFIKMFIDWSHTWHVIPTTIFGEIGLVLFSWILFCNQVDLGRRKRAAATSSNY